MIARTALFLTLVPLHAAAATAQQFEGVFTTKTLRLSSEIVPAQAGDDQDKARETLSALTVEQLIRLGAEVDSQQMQVKGTRLRGAAGDLPGGGYVLMDAATGLMQIVMPAQRSYTEVSLRDGPRPAQEEDADEPTVEPLGRTQVIGGLRCTGYRVTDGDEVSLAWTTSDPAFRDLFQTQMRMFPDDDRGATRVRSLLARYGYPVMMQHVEEDGSYRVEVWSLERRRLADSLFTILTGFRET
ncbi:MAG: DUF4412 domain-containing protein, partial [Gemmatimonadales bacterium]